MGTMLANNQSFSVSNMTVQSSKTYLSNEIIRQLPRTKKVKERKIKLDMILRMDLKTFSLKHQENEVVL